MRLRVQPTSVAKTASIVCSSPQRRPCRPTVGALHAKIHQSTRIVSLRLDGVGFLQVAVLTVVPLCAALFVAVRGVVIRALCVQSRGGKTVVTLPWRRRWPV